MDKEQLLLKIATMMEEEKKQRSVMEARMEFLAGRVAEKDHEIERLQEMIMEKEIEGSKGEKKNEEEEKSEEKETKESKDLLGEIFDETDDDLGKSEPPPPSSSTSSMSSSLAGSTTSIALEDALKCMIEQQTILLSSLKSTQQTSMLDETIMHGKDWNTLHREKALPGNLNMKLPFKG